VSWQIASINVVSNFELKVKQTRWSTSPWFRSPRCAACRRMAAPNVRSHGSTMSAPLFEGHPAPDDGLESRGQLIRGDDVGVEGRRVLSERLPRVHLRRAPAPVARQLDHHVSHRPHRQRHRLRRFQPDNQHASYRTYQHASYRTYPTAIPIAMSSTSPPSSTGAATTSHVQNSPQQRKRNLPTHRPTPVGKAGFEVWVLIKGTCTM